MEKRDDCRLLVVDREKKTIEHKHFHDIIDYLNPGDVLVRNNTKVIPARLVGIKEDTKGKVEVLLASSNRRRRLGMPRRQCPFGQRRARSALLAKAN
jgi:S-adenosylmethionine:tRNA-ribosyltransferase-isomerase (queuine synthetase)